MQDLVDRRVQQVAVVADDDHGARIVREMVLEPQRTLEVEIVGRLVEQQEIGRGEQRRGERNAHPPSAGEFRAGTQLILCREAEARQDRRGTRRRGMRVDIGEAGLDVGDAMRIMRGLRFTQQGGALGVGGEHHLDQAVGTVRGLLRETADRPPRRQGDYAAFAREFASDGAEQCRLACAVTTDEANARTRRDLHVRVVDQKAPGDAQ